ncbi:MAG: hypothetical protein FJ125_16485, partial [Deltaproteobacteria bacterium]|nr:hypothetical protein [Deltaproteobacteria bacterium]
MRKSDRMHWASGLLVAAVLIPGISGQGEAARPGKKPPASAVQQAKPGGELAAGDTVPTRVQLRDLTSKVVDLGLLCG